MRVGYSLKRLQDLGRVGSILKKLNAHDCWNREELVKLQYQQLSSIVTYAIHHSPFYQELYRNIRTDEPDIDKSGKAACIIGLRRVITDTFFSIPVTLNLHTVLIESATAKTLRKLIA